MTEIDAGVAGLLRDAAEAFTRAAIHARTETERAEYAHLAQRCADVARRVGLRAAGARHPAAQ